jgi:hypothetical protein
MNEGIWMSSEETVAEAVRETRTLLTVIYDSGVEERLMELIAAQGLDGWTRFTGAHGYGGATYKLDSPIWPGTNNVLLLAVTPEQATQLADAVHALQATYRRKPGITIWLQTVTLL